MVEDTPRRRLRHGVRLVRVPARLVRVVQVPGPLVQVVQVRGP